jgi:alkylated DNA nucleotide flippase Atl1
MAKKTFNEKLNSTGDLPKVEDLSDNPKFAERYKANTMLIAAPMQYNEIMARVPEGKIVTVEKIRDYLAKKAGADMTCPMTAGIFTNICANAAVERGDADFPWWRTIRTKGELNEKFPDGIDGHKLHLEMEGFEVIQKGKKYFVKDYEDNLWGIE